MSAGLTKRSFDGRTQVWVIRVWGDQTCSRSREAAVKGVAMCSVQRNALKAMISRVIMHAHLLHIVWAVFITIHQVGAHPNPEPYRYLAALTYASMHVFFQAEDGIRDSPE